MGKSQQIEFIGRAALISALAKARLEVALPLYDQGVDLIVFSTALGRGLPMQLKASGGTRFVMDRKYAAIPNLVIAHVWWAEEHPEIYLQTFGEIIDVLESSINGKAWKGHKSYTCNPAPKRLAEAMNPYKSRWGWLRTRIGEA